MIWQNMPPAGRAFCATRLDGLRPRAMLSERCVREMKMPLYRTRLIRNHVFRVLIATAIMTTAGFAQQRYDYKVLATNKTSTMQKEMTEAADAGYRLEKMMGGHTEFGGDEVVAIMAKNPAEPNTQRYRYKLLATSKTSTMQKELQDAG